MSTQGVDPSERVAIGVSFGNSYSSISRAIEHNVEVIANEDGDRQIPTVLSYVDGDEYTGGQAKAFLVRNPDNTIAFFKDFLGQKFESIDPTYCHASVHPQESGDTVSFKAHDKSDSEPSTLSVTEVTTRFLRRLINSASEHIGKKVTSAVIAVPTNFGAKQREALTEAANKAGLEILQFIAEPVAALLPYDSRCVDGWDTTNRLVLVADLGGTRSDFTVIAARRGMYTILATVHDYDFAGVHLDQALIDHFAKEFLKKHKIDPRDNPRGLAKLRQEAEATKKALSRSNNASFSVESLVDGIDFTSNITRLRYEMIARNVFQGFNRLVESTLKKAELDVLDIDQVILAGGTSNTPRIAANFASIFGEKTKIIAPSLDPTALYPSELSVRGAAWQANVVGNYDYEDIQYCTQPPVTTAQHIDNAIGVVAGSGDHETFVPIIAACTAVPARRAIYIHAPKEGGDVFIRIVEGLSHIKVTKPESKPTKKKVKGEDGNDEEDDDDDDDDEEEEEEEEEDEHREHVWKIGKPLAETALRGVKPNSDIEIIITVMPDLSVDVAAKVSGSGEGGVRGRVPKP